MARIWLALRWGSAYLVWESGIAVSLRAGSDGIAGFGTSPKIGLQSNDLSPEDS